MRLVLTIVLVTITIFYPFIVYFGLDRFTPSQLALGLFAIIVFRLCLLRRGHWYAGHRRLMALLMLSGIALYAGYGVLSNSETALRYYPVFINLIVLVLFSYTLWRPPSMIEQFARLREGALSPRAVRYTRNVTLAWCIFFVINGSIAAWTALYGGWQIWSLYNGLIAYLLMAVLFVGEWCLRQRVRAQHAIES